MSNYDIAVGMDDTVFNNAMAQLYKEPGNSKYFNATEDVPVQDVGNVTISWDVKKTPVFVLSPPSPTDWDNALDSNGVSNKKAGKTMPKGNLFQLCFPEFKASYTTKGHPAPTGGTARNVYVYATLSVNCTDDVSCRIEAVNIDESDFTLWDKGIFNLGLLPQICSAANIMLQDLAVLPLSGEGYCIRQPLVQIQDSYLVVAAVLTSASSPTVDLSGVVWPQKSVFILLSPTIVDIKMAPFATGLAGKTKSDSGEYKKLATWKYTATIKEASALAERSDPTKIDLSVSFDVSVAGSLTALGVALAVVGCACGAALMGL
jgi:hypothetical protein